MCLHEEVESGLVAAKGLGGSLARQGSWGKARRQF